MTISSPVRSYYLERSLAKKSFSYTEASISQSSENDSDSLLKKTNGLSPLLKYTSGPKHVLREKVSKPRKAAPCTVTNDRRSSLAVTTIPHHKLEVAKHPALSPSINWIIHSITGNSSIRDAQVICMSDNHIDFSQKFLRAAIINHLLFIRKINRPILFLIEAVPSGERPCPEAYHKLIGYNLIHFPHHVIGWDHMMIHSKGIELIRLTNQVGLQKRKKEAELRLLEKERMDIFKETHLSDEIISEKFDAIQYKIDGLKLQIKADGLYVKKTIGQVVELAEDRNPSLYYTIRSTAFNNPKVLIFVIAGEKHFTKLSQEIPEIDHCIVRIVSNPLSGDYLQAMDEYYGH